MYETVVAIDLETTGPDAYVDRIIEIGALVVRNGEAAERFSELVNPGCPLSPGIVKLTGITPDMLKDARPADAVLADFLSFLPDGALCLAHNAMFERAFLRVATKDRFKHVVMDTVELSRILFPTFASHGLGALADELDLRRAKDGDAHRALADCEMLARLWAKMLERAREIPLAVLGELNYLLAEHARHPYRDFFQRLAADSLARRLGQETDFEKLFAEGPLPAPLPPADPDRTYAPLDPERIRAMFEPGGKVAAAQPGYERRAAQEEMAGKMAEALSGSKHLLVEAGTGTGKSLAYLVPAVLWAVENKAPVVISTNTKNLQSQLADKELPFLKEALGIDFAHAVLKGRRNYLCLRKLFYVLRQATHELDAEERLRMANILPWAAGTETGDISENIVAGRPGFQTLWSKLSTVGEDCLGRGCRMQRKCFLWRARAKSMAADVVVANHALVFSELNMKTPALPPAEHIIFDEAHNLEDAATSHLTFELSQSRLMSALSRLYRAGKKGGTGLMSAILAALAQDGIKVEGDLRDQAVTAAQRVADGVTAVAPAMEPFFQTLEGVLASKGKGESARFDAERKRLAVWAPVAEKRQALFAAVGNVLAGLGLLAGALREMEKGAFSHQAEFLREIEAVGQWLREITEDAQFVLDADSEDYVYWVERVPPKMGGARAFAAPVVVGPLLFDQLYARKRTIVFCSATMTVKGSFDFLSRRLGIDLIPPERLLSLAAGTPFDYRKQCLVAAPLFLPEPGESGKNYAADLGVLLAEVYRRTEGRGMALFTSYDMLQKTADVLERELVGDGIRLLVQGRSGSREGILAAFKRGGRTALLGTHSFWEGVDVVGDALSCLAIARLPFQVQTDPLVEARCQRVEKEGGNAFLDYSLPSAVVKFRQGFGRLIRHRGDRGVAILADRRVVVKRYGQWFRASIPAATETFSDRERFLDAVEDFLRGDADG